MSLPTFFIAGAAKSGTTSLHEYLAQSPDIFMSEIKEPHFFSHDGPYKKGLPSYEKLFEKGRTCLHRGESSTGYMVFKISISRIARHIRSPKFIFLLRNPVDRAYSHYNYLKGMGFETRSFQAAFCADMHEVPSRRNWAGVCYKYYYQFGCYGSLLERFVQRFGRNSIHILTTERLKRQPLESVNSCLEFLDAPLLAGITVVQSNRTLDLTHKKTFGCFLVGRRLIKEMPLKQVIPKNIREMYTRAARRTTNAFLSSGKLMQTDPISPADRLFVSTLYGKEYERLKRIMGSSFQEWEGDFYR